MTDQITPKQAYAGTLPSQPMVIPKNTVVMLYNPSGSVGFSATPLRGQAPWSVNLASFGGATKILIDGRLWGTVVSTGSGSIQYVYLPRDLAAGIEFSSAINVDASQVVGGTDGAFPQFGADNALGIVVMDPDGIYEYPYGWSGSGNNPQGFWSGMLTPDGTGSQMTISINDGTAAAIGPTSPAQSYFFRLWVPKNATVLVSGGKVIGGAISLA
jgi:hypothetical protein